MSFQLFASSVVAVDPSDVHTVVVQPRTTGLTTAKERILGRARRWPRRRSVYEASAVSGEDILRLAADPSRRHHATKYRTAGLDVVVSAEPVQPSPAERKAAKAKAHNKRRREAKKQAKAQAQATQEQQQQQH
jgi:hypothetical protein